jgi:hypothetical protein
MIYTAEQLVLKINNCSGSHEISRLLRKQRRHYVHRGPLLDIILSGMNPVVSLT